jgi:predicted kinase
VHLVIITGLPGTGKTTLARELAIRRRLPLISKDTIKEPLLDMLDCEPSRVLSDISFAVLFALCRDMLFLGSSLILEGNFRAGEHEEPLLAALPAERPNIVQVLCQLDEGERREVLLRRRNDPGRHAGHNDAQHLDPAPECNAFLELPGARHAYRVGFTVCETLL